MDDGFCLRVVGVTYDNKDGTSRQDEIRLRSRA